MRVLVKPSPFLIPNGGTVQFSAEVSGTLQKGVSWRMDGAGSIDPRGRYTATIDERRNNATIIATSEENPSVVGAANVTITEFKKTLGEVLDPGVDTLALGGIFVNGQIFDLNQDAFLDLLTWSASKGELAFFGGQGQGKFVKLAIPVNDPVAMVTGDFLASGNSLLADVAVASGVEEKILFYQALADTWKNQGTPAAAAELSITPRRPVSLASGRFHDSNQVDRPISDLIVGTDEGKIVFFQQDRSVVPFTFTEKESLNVGGLPIQMLPGDFNQDGLIDLAVVREGLSEVLLLFGDGLGGFFPSSGTLALPDVPTFLAIGQFNDDERVDLVAAHAASKQISVALGNGDGSFAAPAAIALESAPGTLTVADFNVAGNDDIAVALPASNAIYLLFGDGTGRFIGDWRYDTEALSPATLISGFFSGFLAPQGNQSVDLVYLGINTGTAPPSDQFFFLTNQNF